jgi:hypothetical protein
MGKLIDLTGKRFGRLRVIRRAESVSERGDTLWLCACSCGNTTTTSSHRLRYGETKSCGCYKREVSAKRTGALNRGRVAYNRMEPLLAAKRAFYAGYRKGARERSLNFEISFELFCEIISKPCYYCGCEFSVQKSTHENTGILKCNGIDRIDSLKSYVIDNIVPCCTICNRAKSDTSLVDFNHYLDALVAFRLASHTSQ